MTARRGFVLPLWRRRPHFRVPFAESALVTAVCEHDWQYLEREPGETYTGYCERCAKCGEIVQVPQ